LTAAELFTGNLNNFRGIFNWTSLIAANCACKSSSSGKLEAFLIAASISATVASFVFLVSCFTMVKFGVESINPEGEPFNPELHEAITMLPMPDKESNTVLDVVQVGFTLNGRLVRPAMVVVVQ
jgi:hypothetical protein